MRGMGWSVSGLTTSKTAGRCEGNRGQSLVVPSRAGWEGTAMQREGLGWPHSEKHEQLQHVEG